MAPAGGPRDHHEWLSFELDGQTYLFDVTFLLSNWECIYGNGCPGVLAAPAVELHQGCCSHGAHFTDEADRHRVVAAAARLTPGQWQHHTPDDPTVTVDGDTSTRLVDDACIFLNRPGFPGGVGCALQFGAQANGERVIDVKPDVCWQLPLRVEYSEDDNGHTTTMMREWKRRDWGAGGEEFHWWCTTDDRAFVGREPVYITMQDEIIALVGEAAHRELVTLLGDLTAERRRPHPAVSVAPPDGGRLRHER